MSKGSNTPQALATRKAMLERQLDDVEARIAATKAGDPDESDAETNPDETDTETNPDETETETDPDETETETDPDETQTETDPDDDAKAQQKREDEVEARVTLFQSFAEAKGNQGLAAQLARDGVSAKVAKSTMLAARKDRRGANLSSRTDHGVSNSSARPAGDAQAVQDLTAFALKAGFTPNQKQAKRA